MKVLVAEDEDFIREGLVDILEGEGYKIIEAANGREALELFNSENPDFVCLDIMMPDMNGYDVCRAIREKCQRTPVIFISAKSEEIDKVLGLELGADDYIVKPFGMREVVARIRAVTRRCLIQQEDSKVAESIQMADITVSPLKLSFERAGEEKELALRDVKILEYFNANPNRALSRAQIFQECWQMEFTGNTRTLDQKISKLRKVIEIDPQNPQIIQTVHGFGYIYKTG